MRNNTSTLSPTIPIRTALGSSPGFCSEKQATKRLMYGSIPGSGDRSLAQSVQADSYGPAKQPGISLTSFTGRKAAVS
jgi:hypothetical protein